MKKGAFIHTTKHLITRNGVPVQLVEVVEGEYDVETGSTVNTEKITNAVAFPRRLRVNQYNYPDLIDKEVVEFIFAAQELGKEPQPNDRIIWDGVHFFVKRCETNTGHNQPLLYRAISVKG